MSREWPGNLLCAELRACFAMTSVWGRPRCYRVRYWHQEMLEHGGPYLACALIGNKSDSLERQVSFLDGYVFQESDEGKDCREKAVSLMPIGCRVYCAVRVALAEEIGALFFETSATRGDHVDAVFVTTCAAAMQQHAKQVVGELKFARSLSQMSSFSDKAAPGPVPNGTPVAQQQEQMTPPPQGCCTIS